MNLVRSVRLPIHIEQEISKLLKVESNFIKKMGRDPEPEELAELFGGTVERIEKLKKMSLQAHSFDHPLSDDAGSATLIDRYLYDNHLQSPLEHLIRTEGIHSVIDAVNKLKKPNQKEVIMRRYGLLGYEEHTLQETSIEIGVSEEMVRQIQKEAERVLKLYLDTSLQKDLEIVSLVNNKEPIIKQAMVQRSGKVATNLRQYSIELPQSNQAVPISFNCNKKDLKYLISYSDVENDLYSIQEKKDVGSIGNVQFKNKFGKNWELVKGTQYLTVGRNNKSCETDVPKPKFVFISEILMDKINKARLAKSDLSTKDDLKIIAQDDASGAFNGVINNPLKHTKPIDNIRVIDKNNTLNSLSYTLKPE